MTDKEIIASGDLELYVCGALPETEANDIQKAISGSVLLQKEVATIEASYIALAENVAPSLSAGVWTYIIGAIKGVRHLEQGSKKTNWAAISGWAAAIAVLGGLVWMINQNTVLEKEVEFTTTENTELQETLNNAEAQQEVTDGILADIRSEAYKKVLLSANATVAPSAFAKAYYNVEDNIAYIDATDLPPAPKGKVYQVWSLKMEPLTPNSMGLLETVTTVKPGLYKFENFPSAEGFGITLEPAGGSEAPTLTQLYVLGTVGNTP